MKKVSIEIEDISNSAECVLAARKLFTAFVDCHGEKEAFRLWRENRDLNTERWRAYYQAERKLNYALFDLSHEDGRLVLEYHAMAKPSKRRLAIELTEKNENGAHYGANSTTELETMLQQIKRVFRNHPEACRIIGEAPPVLRHEAMRAAEHISEAHATLRAEGLGSKLWPGSKAHMKRGGHKRASNVPGQKRT